MSLTRELRSSVSPCVLRCRLNRPFPRRKAVDPGDRSAKLGSAEGDVVSVKLGSTGGGVSSLSMSVRQRSARSWRVLTENRGRRGPMSHHSHRFNTFYLFADYPPRFFLRKASLRPWISVKTRHETDPSLSNRDWHRPGCRARSRRCRRRPRPLGGKGPPEAPGHAALGGPVRPLPTAVRRG